MKGSLSTFQHTTRSPQLQIRHFRFASRDFYWYAPTPQTSSPTFLKNATLCSVRCETGLVHMYSIEPSPDVSAWSRIALPRDLPSASLNTSALIPTYSSNPPFAETL